MAESSGTGPDRLVFITRVMTALVQAAALYVLVGASDPPYTWPATSPRASVPMFLVAAFVPIVLSLAVGRIPPRPLTIWIGTATVIVAGLGYHDIARGAVPSVANQTVFWPSYQLWLALFAGVFIAHVLVVDAIVERRLLASYTRHFDTAWKLTLQGVLAAVFVAVFWGLITLGTGLFKLVDIGFFVDVIQHRWFAYPATALAIAVAIQATDVQPALIRGARSLALTLFSWLLPLLAAILLAFIAILPFVSLAPLWKTHFATGFLLAASGAIIFLINCCYQDGAAEQVTSRIRRFAGTLGAIELVPLAGLAAWGLSLRVAQYGWSTERIFAAAAIGVACCYAIGYASAALRSAGWLQRIELTNAVTAWVILAVILALFSPVGDPARLMVANQLGRLKSNKVKPGAFDFVALKFDGARWGAAALTELSQSPQDSPDAMEIRSAATRALGLTDRYVPRLANQTPPTAQAAAERINVYPPGHSLPPAFLDAEIWGLPEGRLPACFQSNQVKCSAFFVTLSPGDPEALVVFGNLGSGIVYPVFEQDHAGHWRKTGQLLGSVYCADVREGLEHGKVAMKPHGWPDLVIGGQSLIIAPSPVPCD
jgi:hypothetical protein